MSPYSRVNSHFAKTARQIVARLDLRRTSHFTMSGILRIANDRLRNEELPEIQVIKAQGITHDELALGLASHIKAELEQQGHQIIGPARGTGTSRGLNHE